MVFVATMRNYLGVTKGNFGVQPSCTVLGMNDRAEVLNAAELLLAAALGGEIQQFRPVLEGVARGEHVVVSGLPASGKTTLLAVLLNCWEESLALTGSGAQAKALARRAFDLRLDNAVVGDSRSFASAVWGFFNEMRRAADCSEVRLLSDAEVLAWMDPWLESNVPGGFAAAVGTQGFRQNLLDGLYRVRCVEKQRTLGALHPWVRGILGKLRQQVKTSQSQGGKNPWELDAGSLYEEYLQALEAGKHVAQPSLVLLDDWQNANGLMQEIVCQWAATGTQVVAVGLADLSCNEYRGGEPQALQQLAQRLQANLSGRKVRQKMLTETYVNDRLESFWRDTVNTFGVSTTLDLWKPLGEAHPVPQEKPSAEDGLSGVHLIEAANDARQYRFIGRFLQEVHLFSDPSVPYSQMAVLVNSKAVGHSVCQQLKSLGVPASLSEATSQINEGRFSAWLLRLLKLACAKTWDFTDFLITDFLQSEFFGWGSARLRQLDDALKDLAYPMPRQSDFSQAADFESAISAWEMNTNKLGILPWVKEFWEDLLASRPFHNQDLETVFALGDAKRLAELYEVLVKVQDLWQKDSGNVQMMLWVLWDGLGRGEELRELTFTSELDSIVRDQLNLELDLVMDLFKAADWYEQRYPGGDAAVFAKKMFDRSLPTVSVAPHHQSTDAVTITTPIGAASRHWKVVAVAGLNDGAWPSRSWPGDLLGTSMFDLSRDDTGTDCANLEVIKAGFQWSFHADLRRFLAAITRATETLVLGTTTGDFESPSPLVLRLADNPAIVVHKDVGEFTSKPEGTENSGAGTASFALLDNPPSNLRDMVARLRILTMLSDAQVQMLGVGSAEQSEAASLLAWLGNAPGSAARAANPENWMGILRPTVVEPAVSAGETTVENKPVFRIRASGMESLLNNPFDTEMSRLGYEDEREEEYNAAIIGTLIHKVAEEMGRRHWYGSSCDDKVDKLKREEICEETAGLMEKLLEGSRAENWMFINFERRLNYLLKRMNEFLYDHQVPSLFECGYRMTIPDSNNLGQISYTARIDRVLFTESGIVLADYKTGSLTNYTKPKVANNLQLLLYQKAFNEGRPIGGAPQGLVADAAWIVGLRGDKTTVVAQGSLADELTVVKIAKPFTAQHRLLLQDSQTWIEKKRRGETDFGLGDPEGTTLAEFLQDRVNLAVAALAGRQLVQRQESGSFFKANTLPVEVEYYA